VQYHAVRTAQVSGDQHPALKCVCTDAAAAIDIAVSPAKRKSLLRPESISAAVLARLVANAERKLNTKVSGSSAVKAVHAAHMWPLIRIYLSVNCAPVCNLYRVLAHIVVLDPRMSACLLKICRRCHHRASNFRRSTASGDRECSSDCKPQGDSLY
jgi:hypothetical protein